MDFRNVTLEVSLKPFKDDSEATARTVCREMFRQWYALCRHADTVSVLLWIADGSEILEYRGDPRESFEWAKWLGRANQSDTSPWDPDGIGLHSRPYLYREAPPEFTYGWLRRLVSIIKEEGRQVTGRRIRVGETFDPGPEFAKSPFKFERHPELCMGRTMGKASFACCYARLHADPTPYAGFPEGIPEGLPFGVFLGRQSEIFLKDMGFDYLWLSNGFGFGLEPWGLRGAVFDGKRFSAERCDDVRAENLDFWRLFRTECPAVPIETRGTNLGTGMDLASDAVPLREIYSGDFNMTPPPNSPWAAINHDFGLELVGWMSHIAEIPGDEYPFRFYTHDPWWINSPWLDRYGREPHDIYLPLAVCRLDGKGVARPPTSILFLTVDDSYGNMLQQVPDEVIPHILACRREAPDQAGPLLWVYPFDEYHRYTFEAPNRIDEVFFGDWFMRGAVNNGLPLNTVVSTANFVSAVRNDPGRFIESVLVSPVPLDGSAWQRTLLEHVRAGGRLLLYGPVGDAGPELLDAINVRPAEPVSGQFEIEVSAPTDVFAETAPGTTLLHHELLCAGGMRGVLADDGCPHTSVLARVARGGVERIAALTRSLPEWRGGCIVWVRGTVACDPKRTGGHLLVPLDPVVHFPAEVLMRHALEAFGYRITVEKYTSGQKTPMTCVSRHANAFFLAGFTPDTTTALRLRFPQGVPLLLGLETRQVDGQVRYSFPKAWRRECRVFVDQAADGPLACREVHSGMVGIKRRMQVDGLMDATVRFYHEPGTEQRVRVLRDPHPPYVHGDFRPVEVCRDALGNYCRVEGVTGTIMISW
ncbi:MAG: hypothetical protein GXP31_16820 [Kiritimatiellaeota bacterium]|nr:hypothetical protein [Kiritimatiellota bacterium]